MGSQLAADSPPSGAYGHVMLSQGLPLLDEQFAALPRAAATARKKSEMALPERAIEYRGFNVVISYGQTAVTIR
jgi:hypothetical protein